MGSGWGRGGVGVGSGRGASVREKNITTLGGGRHVLVRIETSPCGEANFDDLFA